MLSLPKAAQPLLSRFSIAFTKPTYQRAMVLFVGFVLTVGRHTLTRTLSTVRSLTCGYFGSYHRVVSRARWSLWVLAKVLAAAVLELVPADQPVLCDVDDTTAQHRGKTVYGKGRHRDPLRSTRTHNVWIWGHLWVVLAINVQFPFCSRPWALPVLCALYRTKEANRQEGRRRRRHKTPIMLARQLMAALMHWFPKRHFILLGDGHYASHELARFCHRHRRRLTLVSLFHPQAHLRQPPPPRRQGQMGRRRIRGAKLPHPQDMVKSAKRKRSTVTWYGGKRRRVEFVSQTAHWYKPADGLVPVRWVFVHDRDGTHEDRYFYSTDPTLSASRIISLYTARWSIEVTFQEAKQRLGLATPRNRKDKSVLRTVPCLLGLFSVVAILFHRHTGSGKAPQPYAFAWYAKSEVTFSDALTSVRRLLWAETVFSELDQHDALKKIPRVLRENLLDQLSRAA